MVLRGPAVVFQWVALLAMFCSGAAMDQQHLRIGSGFSLASLQRQLLRAGTRAHGKTQEHYSAAERNSLELSANAQMLKHRLTGARTHFQDAILKIEDYTNPIEMGLHPIPHFTGADADALDKKLLRPLKKAEESLLDMQNDLRDIKMLQPRVRSSCNDAVDRGTKSLAWAHATVDAVRRADNDGAMKQLSLLRDGVDFIGTLAEKSAW